MEIDIIKILMYAAVLVPGLYFLEGKTEKNTAARLVNSCCIAFVAIQVAVVNNNLLLTAPLAITYTFYELLLYFISLNRAKPIYIHLRNLAAIPLLVWALSFIHF